MDAGALTTDSSKVTRLLKKTNFTIKLFLWSLNLRANDMSLCYIFFKTLEFKQFPKIIL